MKTTFLFIGGPEIFIIILIVIMVFGADKIPDIARSMGKGIRQVKDATNEIKKEIKDTSKDKGLNTDIAGDIKKEIESVKEGVKDITGPIKRNF